VYLLDNTYNIIATVTLSGIFNELTPGVTFPSNIDLHEINITPQGTVLVTANNVTTTDLTSVGGPKVGWIVDSLFYEIDIATNKVLFRWSSLDHVDAIPLSSSVYHLGSEGFTGVNQSLAWGYAHINSVAKLGDGYVVSFRYLCAGIALSKKGDVLWTLQGISGGDFKLGTDTNFCFQHDIRPITLTSETLTLSMHDNANAPINVNTSTTPTSGLELSIDFTTKTVSKIFRYFNPAEPIFATSQGNFQHILSSSNIFMGHGIIPVFQEFTQAGAIAMTAQFAALQPTGAGLSYRAFNQPWVGCPSTPPAIYADVENGTTTVYASWNGATEYRTWTVLAGNTISSLSVAAKVARAGFETKIALKGSPSVVQVEAVNCGKWSKSVVFTL
jgi:Arylsulfotransferase (ASST)